MKAEDLSLYQLFYNYNNHLSLVYKITDTKVYIISHNGSIYTVSKNGGTSNYTPCLKNITVQDFFDDYPEHLLHHYEAKVSFNAIRERCLNKRQEKNKLLLIL